MNEQLNSLYEGMYPEVVEISVSAKQAPALVNEMTKKFGRNGWTWSYSGKDVMKIMAKSEDLQEKLSDYVLENRDIHLLELSMGDARDRVGSAGSAGGETHPDHSKIVGSGWKHISTHVKITPQGGRVKTSHYEKMVGATKRP